MATEPRYSSRAVRDLRKLGRPDAERVREAVRRFADRGHGDVKALRGVPGGWLRLRAGEVRAIVRRREGLVEVARVVDRRDLEQALAKLRR